MKKQPEVTKRTKQNLVDAFCELYSHKPIEKISISEITSSAGYHRSTFYQYFVDIYDILEYVENSLLHYVKEELGKSKNNLQTPNPHNLLVLFEKKEKYLSALLGSYGSFRFLNKLKEEIISNSNILFPPQYMSIAPYIIEFHMSTSVSLFQLWLHRGKDLSSDELSDLIHKLYTSGISAIMPIKA